MFDYDRLLSPTVTSLKKSGIRKFFDLLEEMDDVVSLTVGQPDFVTPWHIRDEGIYSLERGRTFYTSNAGLKELREEISRYVSRKYDLHYDPVHEIFVTVGGSEAIDVALRCMTDPGDEVLIPQPSYVSYLPCAVMADAVPVPIELKAENDFKLTKEQLLNSITDKTKILVLPYPNNPTGALYPKEILEQIVELAREHELLIFADEIYDRLVMDGKQHISIASLAPDLCVVSFNGLSKSHLIAGYRCGWMCISGDKSRAKGYIEGINLLSSMRLCANVPTQSVIPKALEMLDSTKEMLEPGGRVYEQREYIYNALNDIPGVSAVKPEAAFYIFPKMDMKKFHIKDDEKFALDFLKEKKILVTHGGGFHWNTPDHFRIVYLPDVDTLTEACTRMKDFFAHYVQD